MQKSWAKKKNGIKNTQNSYYQARKNLAKGKEVYIIECSWANQYILKPFLPKASMRGAGGAGLLGKNEEIRFLMPKLPFQHY